jgi:hypothetical protein
MGVHLKLGDSFAFKAEDTKIRVTKGSQAQWFKPVILAPQEIEIRRIVVQGQSGQKFARLHLSGKSWVWWHVPVILVTEGSVKYEAGGPSWPRQKVRPYFQNNQSKKG